MPQKTQHTGLTLIELLMTLALVAIMMGLGLWVGTDFYRRYTFYSDRMLMLSILRRAREYALVHSNTLPHGVAFFENRYVVFAGSSYITRNSFYDEVIEKSPSVLVSGISEIVFAPLSGTSTASGTIGLTNGVQSADIHINYEGRISW
jgi:prepilin-type N-terminal cleavage/methylation domain-containing protein